MAHKLRYVPGPVGAVVSNDWCINLKYRNYAIKVSDRPTWVNSAEPDHKEEGGGRLASQLGTDAFQTGQCAALSSFGVRWHFSGKRVGFLKSDK